MCWSGSAGWRPTTWPKRQVSLTRRAQLHRRTGEALEGLLDERADDQAAALAYHFSVAGVLAKAYEYHSRAATAAEQVYAIEPALAHYTAALEAAAEIGVSHLLCAGSADEFGDQEGIVGPGVPARPITVYGLCKSLLREIADFHARGSTMRVDWFRPFHVYGPGQRGSSVIAYAFEAVTADVVAEFTDGAQSRDFTYVDDVVDWLIAGLRSPAGDGHTGGLAIHHLGTGVATPIRDVLAAIAAEFPSSRFDLGVRPRRPGEPDCQIAPPPAQSADAQWRWTPRISLAEGLDRTAEWWRAGALVGTEAPHAS